MVLCVLEKGSRLPDGVDVQACKSSNDLTF